MLYVTYIADNLGTVRKSKNSIESQGRDIQLYLEHFKDSSIEIDGKLSGGEVLHDWLFSAENPHKYVASILRGEVTVIVAYLSALGRNNEEIAKVINSLDGHVIVAELPEATAEELGIYAKLEDSKKKFMGIRSKAGITKAKAEGKKVGGLRESTKERNEQAAKKATVMAESIRSYLLMFIERGFTLKQGADLLNERGIKTAQGKEFKPMTVKRYLDRLTD
jgi:hypothetical protein